jgi:hypothetical protein
VLTCDESNITREDSGFVFGSNLTVSIDYDYRFLFLFPIVGSTPVRGEATMKME